MKAEGQESTQEMAASIDANTPARAKELLRVMAQQGQLQLLVR